MNKSILLWGAPTCVPENLPLAEQFAHSGNNFGNILIGYGAQRLFPDGSVAFRKDFKSVAEINEQCSHVVIPAANLLWKGFDFSSMLPFLRQITLPIVMIGVGAQTSNRNVASLVHPGTVELMHHVSDRCHSIGVRGHYTAEVLASCGIHNTTVTGCPSLYMQRSSDVLISASNNDLLSALSVNFSRRVNAHSFNPAASRHLDNILMQLAIVEDACFVAQDEIEELSFALSDEQQTSVFTQYFDQVDSGKLEAFFRAKSHYFTDVHSWSTFLKTRTLSVGSRFHGNLLALLNGTPAFCITHDSRTLELCALLGIPHLNVAEPGATNMDTATFLDLVHKGSYEAFQHSLAALHSRMKQFLADNNLPSALN